MKTKGKASDNARSRLPMDATLQAAQKAPDARRKESSRPTRISNTRGFELSAATQQMGVFQRSGLSRRDFLQRCAVLAAGTAAASAASVLVPAFAGAEALRGGQAVSLMRPYMGTFVAVTVVDPSRARAEEAVGRAFKAVAHWEAVFTRFDSASPVSALNDAGRLADAPPELARLLAQCMTLHRVTGGAFDPTVLPVVRLVSSHAQNGEVRLAPGELEAADALVGIGRMRLSGGSVSFARAGMGLTLDGVAKGRVVDLAAEAIREAGATSFLINAGGEIRAAGSPERGGAWRVAVEDPSGRGRPPAVVELSDGALATSGNYEAYYDKDRLYHHIVDPGSGRSPGLAAGVSVAAPTCAEADALATSWDQGPGRGPLLRCQAAPYFSQGATERPLPPPAFLPAALSAGASGPLKRAHLRRCCGTFNPSRIKIRVGIERPLRLASGPF